MGISEKNVEDPFVKYYQLFAQRDYAEASVEAERILSKNFHDGHAVYALAQCYKEAERFGQAYSLYERAAVLLNNSPDPWVGMGLCYTEQWKLDEAERCF